SWAVRDPGGQYIFSDEVPAGPIAPDMFQTVTASQTFIPSLVGEYFVICVIDAPNDASALNDTTYLRMFTGGLPRWYRYDDNGDAEGQVTFEQGTGKGVVFRPSEYPAQVESLRVYVAGAGAATVHIYANDATGEPTGLPLWEHDFTAVSGWNRLAVAPPVPVYSNSITAVYLFGMLAFGKDNSAPNAAENVNMGHVGWESFGGAWEADLTGNWLLQAYMDDAPAPPSIAWQPDSLLFGPVDISSSETITLWFYNRGTGADLEITAMTVSPIGIASAFTFNPTTLTIPAADSASVDVVFDPPSVRTYNGLFRVTNNSANLPTANIVIRAEGVLDADIPEYGLPTEFALAQNYPNPFNPSTEIRFALPVTAEVRLAVFNLLGQEMAVLAQGTLPAGVYARSFDASELPAGVYFYRLEAGSFTDIKKMMLLK
ncbi:T9SS type A sorting domain-containing protein, partial [bacterium]|nr:T9SS type A sorting domain-containing protein [bacterium]MBU1984782.1 T9SS type A sorting domain-containing protein [bacterium]